MINAGRAPFTSVQWAELEHQALIFKYMMAGLNVPPELLNPIRKSVASLINGMTASHHAANSKMMISLIPPPSSLPLPPPPLLSISLIMHDLVQLLVISYSTSIAT
jgi:hypothetical protein